MYLLEGRYEDAIESLNRSIELRPTMYGIQQPWSGILLLHRFPESVAALEKARALDERSYINWGDLADALYWMPSRRPEATQVYRKAIELARESVKVNPKDSGALSCIASYSAMLDDRETAFDALQQALAVSPNDADVMFRAAVVHNHFGQREQTLTWLRKAIKGGFSLSTVRDTPDFAQLQQDPAFRELLRP